MFHTRSEIFPWHGEISQSGVNSHLFSSSLRDLADKETFDCRFLSYKRVDEAQTSVSCKDEGNHHLCYPLGSPDGKFQMSFLNTKDLLLSYYFFGCFPPSGCR